MPSEKIFNRNSTDKPRPIGDPQWVLELKNKLLTNEILLLAIQDAAESDLVKGEDTVCRWGSFFTSYFAPPESHSKSTFEYPILLSTGFRSDKRVMEKVANAAREYASEAARLGIVDVVEKSCDETKAGKGAPKVHGKSHKVVVLGQTSCGEGEVENTEALLAAAETKQLTGLATLTGSNKLERFIALEKKRKSDPFIVFDNNSNEVEDPSEEYTAEALVEDGTDLIVDGDKRDSIAWWGIRTDPVSTTHLISELKRRKEVKWQAVEAKRIMDRELEVQKRLEEQQASRERSREIERVQDRERAAEELKQRSWAANSRHAQVSSSSSSSSVGGRGRISFPQCSIVTGPSPAYFPQPPPLPVTLTFPSQKSIITPSAFKHPPAFPQQHHQQQKQHQQQHEKHQNFGKVQAHSQSPHLSGTFPQRSIQRSQLDSNGVVISTSYPTLPSNDSAVGVTSTSNHHHNNHHNPLVFSFSSQATAGKTGRSAKPGTGISFGRRDGIGVGTSSSSSSSSFSSSSSSSSAGYGDSFPNRSTAVTSPSTSTSTPSSSSSSFISGINLLIGSSHNGNSEKGVTLTAGMPHDTNTLNASGSSSISAVSKKVGSCYRQSSSNSVSHLAGDSLKIGCDAAMMKKNTGNNDTSSDYNTKEKRNFYDINSHKSDSGDGNIYDDNHNQKQNQNHGNGRRSSTGRYEGTSDALNREREGSSRLSGTLRGREDDSRMGKGRNKQDDNNPDRYKGWDNEVELRNESKPNAFNSSSSSSSNSNANANDSFHKRNKELYNSHNSVPDSDSKYVSFPIKTGTYTPHQTYSNDNNNSNNNNTNNNNNNSSSNYINSNSSHHNNSHHNTNDNKFKGDGNNMNNLNNNSNNNENFNKDRAYHQNTYGSSIDKNHKNSNVNTNDYKESAQKTYNSHSSSSDYRQKNGNVSNSNNSNNQYDGNKNRNGDHESGRRRSRSRSKGNGRGRSRGRSKERSRSRDRDRVRSHTQQNRV